MPCILGDIFVDRCVSRDLVCRVTICIIATYWLDINTRVNYDNINIISNLMYNELVKEY